MMGEDSQSSYKNEPEKTVLPKYSINYWILDFSLTILVLLLQHVLMQLAQSTTLIWCFFSGSHPAIKEHTNDL